MAGDGGSKRKEKKKKKINDMILDMDIDKTGRHSYITAFSPRDG